MSTNGTANKGGRQPLRLDSGKPRPLNEAQKRALYGNFLRSLGVQPQPPDRAVADEPKRATPDQQATPPTLSSEILKKHETLVDRIRRNARGKDASADGQAQETAPGKAKKRTGTDGYSREFSLDNLPNLRADGPYDRLAVSEAPELEGLEIPPGEELSGTFEIGPPPQMGGSSEISTTISDAVVQAVARANGEGKKAASAMPPKLPSERPTLPPSPVIASSSIEEESDGRRAAILPGFPPETVLAGEQVAAPKREIASQEPGFVSAIPSPAGIVRGINAEGVPDAVFDAGSRKRRASVLLEAAQGISQDAMDEAGAGNMGVSELRENSTVELMVQNSMPKIPNRFHSTIEEAMEILTEGLDGFEPLVEKFIRERRWTRAEEESLEGAYMKTADHLQKLFDKRYDQESKSRIESWEEYPGKLADIEKRFAFTIIGAKDQRSNYETNVFDAFAKGAMLAYLIQQRPGSFIEAIGHPEKSKPYGKLGGAENAGIAAGLRLYPENLQLAFLFRCYEETHVLTISNELRDKVIERPTRPLVGKFEEMVRHDVAEFELAVSDAGLSPEKFFEVLNEGHTSESLRSHPMLSRMFEKAEKEGLIYNKADDFFDALELINDYMFALRMNPVARDNFLKFYLANYPLGKDSGNFYKMFGLCLFDSVAELEQNRIARMAFDKDQNPTVRKCLAKRLETLEYEERTTIVMDPADSGGELDFSGM